MKIDDHAFKMASVPAPANAPPTPPMILLATVEAAVLEPITAAVVATVAAVLVAAAAMLATIAEIAMPKIPPYKSPAIFRL